MNVRLHETRVHQAFPEAAQQDLLLQVIVEHTERAAAWVRLLVTGAAVLLSFLSADWTRGGEALQAAGELSVVLLAVGFSWWVLVLPPQERVAQGTVLMSVTVDGLLAFGSLCTTVVNPEPGYAGVFGSLDVSIMLLLIAASAFRMQFLAVIVSAAVNGAGIFVIYLLDRRAGIHPPTTQLLIFLLYFCVSVSLALMAIYMARRAVREAAAYALREERAQQGVRTMLHAHHDLKSLMSDVRLNIERIVERAGDVDGVEPLIRRASSRIEGFGEWLDDARGRVLAILRGDEPVELVHLETAALQVVEQFRDSTQTITCEKVPQVWVPFFGGNDALVLILGHLVFNAVKGRGGWGAQHIVVTGARQGDDWTEICIEDDGPGFCPDFLQTFADPNANMAPTRGLALARSALLDVGGGLFLSNRPERGARVLLRLPSLSVEQGPLASGIHASLG